MIRRIGIVLLLTLLMGRARVVAFIPSLVYVPGNYGTIAEALSTAPDGATIEVAPGEYFESLVIERPIVLRGAAGKVVISGNRDEPVISIVNTQHVTIHGLTLQHGQYGILLIRSKDVVIRNNLLLDNRLVGVKVRMGEASIVGNTITGTLPPYGKGIHITNTMDWPTTLIRGNTVSENATGGIVTNMAMVRVDGNIVVGNGQRGIAITEMSEGVVADNIVDANGENGIYISDQSIAIVCNNTITKSLLLDIAGARRYGNGITIDYRSQVQLHSNVILRNENNAISVIDSSSVASSENIMQGNGADVLWLDASSTQIRNLDIPLSCEI